MNHYKDPLLSNQDSMESRSVFSWLKKQFKAQESPYKKLHSDFPLSNRDEDHSTLWCLCTRWASDPVINVVISPINGFRKGVPGVITLLNGVITTIYNW